MSTVALPRLLPLGARVRELCLSLPQTSERLSHGAPSFFIAAKRMFVTYHAHHRGDGRPALWCAATAGAQQEHIERDAKSYFVPPYVGGAGWIGVRPEPHLMWDEVAGVIEDAWLTRAGPRLLARLGALVGDTEL